MSPYRVKSGILLLIAFATIRADTVELKTGEKIEGVFKQAGSAGVVIEVGGQPITFTMDKVRAIYLGAAPVGQQAVSAYSDALDALKGLQSVTNSSVSYRDYAPRVLDAKVKVDKYLTSASNGDDERRTSIRLVMQHYELAAIAWNARITKTYDGADVVGHALRESAALSECPAVKNAIADSDARATRVNTQTIGGNKPLPVPRGKTLEQVIQETAITFTGSRIGDNPGLLWTCAASKLAEAEKH